MKVWEFVEVKKNPFNEEPDTAPNALYSYILREQGSDWKMGSSMTYKEVKLLLGHFGIEKPEELAEKTFSGARESPSSALNLLIVQIKHGGDYIPPTEETLYERAASALSNMECPDFSDVDDETVFKAFHKKFNWFDVDEKWFYSFQERISALSNGTVQLQKADVEDFSVRVKGPAECLLLIKGNKKQRVILGPYSTPISFD